VQKKLSNWRKWANKLWARAETAWIERNGQDEFYRQRVVVPALTRAILKIRSPLLYLIDLGSGDGKSTSLIVEECLKENIYFEDICLIDRSDKQLGISRHMPHLAKSSTLFFNIGGSKPLVIPESKLPRLLVSIFVIQELPELASFGMALSNVLRQNSNALIITVAPRFSQYLRQNGSIRIEDLSRYPSDRDWNWAGSYPIAGEGGRHYLPHFQRSLAQITKSLLAFRLRIIQKTYLQVPPTHQARQIYENSDYGQLILNVPSSLLLVVKKC
jgi:hypothetical protein